MTSTTWEEPTLFPVPDPAGLARQTDPITSVMAAREITGRTEQALLETFEAGGEFTADDLCRVHPTVFPPTLKSALSRLHNHHLIEPTGELRASDRGRPSIVWTLVR